MTAKLTNFPNIGYLIDDIPQDILLKLDHHIDSAIAEADDVSSLLAGNIEKEYNLMNAREDVQDYIFNLFYYYVETYGYHSIIDQVTDPLPLVIDNLWVNIQEKGEFNPNHRHSGVMSFVIWKSIPYSIKDEFKKAGYFEFVYNDILGNSMTYSIPADKTFNGKIIMFPNRLLHTAYPFFSTDEQRITIAGNISLDSTKKS